jgi:O-acetyl-ADP-ribose deacetylase (regulator of RNase III)
MLSNLSFSFVSLDKNTIEIYSNVFKDFPNFRFRRANITSEKGDCVVSPANSYGLMDGGVDRAINYSLNYISEEVQKLIKENFYGEQPVGTCMLIKTNQDNYKYLAHTPTMRVPMDVNKTLNAYYAFRALLREILNHNKRMNDIKTIVITPFCCGIGKMDIKKSAEQMKIAYQMIEENLDCNWENSLKIERELEKLI